MRFASNATGLRQARIFLNNATNLSILTIPAANGAQTDLVITTQYYLVVGDYVELEAYQNSGGPLNVEAGSNFSPEFMMSLAH